MINASATKVSIPVSKPAIQTPAKSVNIPVLSLVSAQPQPTVPVNPVALPVVPKKLFLVKTGTALLTAIANNEAIEVQEFV